MTNDHSSDVYDPGWTLVYLLVMIPYNKWYGALANVVSSVSASANKH